MKQSLVLKQVFAELRRTFGSEVPARKLLLLAHGLVELYLTDDNNQPLFDDRVGGIPFEEWPVDIAMNDGAGES